MDDENTVHFEVCIKRPDCNLSRDCRPTMENRHMFTLSGVHKVALVSWLTSHQVKVNFTGGAHSISCSASKEVYTSLQNGFQNMQTELYIAFPDNIRKCIFCIEAMGEVVLL